MSALSKYFCLFAHFNPAGVIDESVFTYLQALSDLQIRIAFISNSGLDSDSRGSLAKIPGIAEVVERPNTGNDFGAWQEAIQRKPIPADTDYLLLTNDSIFGPLFDLGPLFTRMVADKDNQFWGITDSMTDGWHLQSYFILLSAPAFRSAVFEKFFARRFDYKTKLEIIEKGEVALSKVLVGAGFKAGVVAPTAEVDPGSAESPLLALNNTHFHWRKLVEEFGVPFIKKELVLKNPNNLQSVANLFPMLQNGYQYKVSNVTDYLVRSLLVTPLAGFAGNITVVCHMYYGQSIYYFLSRISVLKKFNARFIFHVAGSLANDSFFKEILQRSFPGCVILRSTPQGRDIGGKMVAIDAMLRLGISTGYSLIIHDKLSTHSETGSNWRDKLFEILDEKNILQIFSRFDKNPDIGIMASEDYLKNEYDPDSHSFSCSSNDNIWRFLHQYGISLTDYTFVAGTVFWIRSSILAEFFEQHRPLEIRRGLEKGNALDFFSGTNIHAWERIFSFMANASGFKIKGI